MHQIADANSGKSINRRMHRRTTHRLNKTANGGASLDNDGDKAFHWLTNVDCERGCADDLILPAANRHRALETERREERLIGRDADAALQVANRQPAHAKRTIPHSFLYGDPASKNV